MMKIAALYDIHGNFPALKTVLDELDRVRPDRIIIGGDMVSGPMPVQTLNCLLNLRNKTNITFIRGNGDREVVDASKGAPLLHMSEEGRVTTKWVANSLTGKQLDFLSNLDDVTSIHVDELGDVLFCHATPENDHDIFTPLSPKKRINKLFAEVEQSIVVCGHTHIQYEMKLEKTKIFNSGSVGMPFAKQPGAYWLLIDSDQIEFKRTTYDFEQAALEIREAHSPDAEDFINTNVIHVPNEEKSMIFLENLAN
ncbi:metallophosphoesterase family protein [Sporolactobacillus sp. STSJ-5]|uniref:metallophosphoesterase family protein n=1 Tax=Sporolactobacillus sp. STSJ-5 TaxID=2965076 RepID=UPI0021051338|nr:metallophosphoesterase family protein [Sporolactobacillus sp. STSJ-5]MCQ2009789.1 metallophosphoesterase family protein [Sporolactobacillus sp. STSJ-5]